MAILSKSGRIVTGAAAAGMACATAATAKPPPSGFWLMGYAAGGSGGAVNALSQKGLVAAGSTTGVPGFYNVGFRWTLLGGRDDWGLLPGMPVGTYVSSCDNLGVALAGSMVTIDFKYNAYRRVGDGPLENLGVLPQSSHSYATGISGDGSIVVGSCDYGGGAIYAKAFRWTAATGMQDIGKLTPQTPETRAQAISRDGTTIVGQNINEVLWFQAFKWTQAGGMKALPTLTGAPDSSDAKAVNADGTVIVGVSPSQFGTTHAVRWVNGLPQDLASPAIQNNSLALAVSDNGSVVGGRYSAGVDSIALIWTEATGMLDAADYLSKHGIDVPSNIQLAYVYAVSGDGRTFGGYGKNLLTGKFEGFVAAVPDASCLADCDASAELDIDDFICFQTRFAISDPYADCDASGELDIDDFICFQTLFAIGC